MLAGGKEAQAAQKRKAGTFASQQTNINIYVTTGEELFRSKKLQYLHSYAKMLLFSGTGFYIFCWWLIAELYYPSLYHLLWYLYREPIYCGL